MNDAGKPTMGEWRVSLTGKRCKYEIVTDSKRGLEKVVARVEGFFKNDLEANASLIAEAGTVYHETGLTPRQLVGKLAAAEESDADSLRMYRSARDRADQLAEQRDELLRELREIHNWALTENKPLRAQGIESIFALIAKVEAKP